MKYGEGALSSESWVLNGRIEPVGVVEGFKAEIGAGGRFCPKHITLPVTAYFFQLSDDNAMILLLILLM
jgi:hypothetical protein